MKQYQPFSSHQMLASVKPQAEAQPLVSSKMRCSIGLQVVVLHLLVVFGPLGILVLRNMNKPEESTFKVKLVAPAPVAAEAGPLSRQRVTGQPAPPEIPAPPTPAPPTPPTPPKPQPPTPPQVAAPPTPKPPMPTPPKPAPPKTAPAKPAQPKPPTPPKQTTAKPKPAPPAKPSTAKPTTPKLTKEQEALRQVEQARRNAAQRGGTNTNAAVPIGGRDQAPTVGKPNNSAGGGKEADTKVYDAQLGNYVKMRWAEPPDSLLAGTRPEVIIELAVMADGRVSSSRIVKSSGNNAMDDSVRRLLASLDRVPAPGQNRSKIQILLKTSD